MATEMGRIADLLTTAENTETPLARQLDGLGERLAAVAGVAMVTVPRRRARPRRRAERHHRLRHRALPSWPCPRACRWA